MQKNQVIMECQWCSKEVSLPPSHARLRKTCSHYCGQKLRWSREEYRQHMSEVHKGQKAWNKNKFLVDNPKGRRQPYYRRLVFEVSETPTCKCGEEAKLVHHIDRNLHNNEIKNLEPMCYSCHAIEHNVDRNLPSVNRQEEVN